MTSISESTIVEAAALSELYSYLCSAQPYTEGDELIARDAFLTAWTKAVRWTERVHEDLPCGYRITERGKAAIA